MSAPIKKIMLFDDDDDIVAICTFILEEDGWLVQAYPDCSDLINKIISFSPDVILMDNWIPDEGGIIATQAIKAETTLTNIPVIYFSANSNIESLANAAGADTYLPKPFDLEFLKATALSVLQAK